MSTTTDTRPTRRGPATRTRMVSALVALSIGVAGLGLTACGTEPSTPGYETVSYAGENPFTPPVGTDDPDVQPVEGGGGEQGGDTDGLYAQNPDAPSCDPAALVTSLQSDEAKANAWAEVLGIDTGEIEDFVKSLSPVVLRSATAVTNYSYADGTYRAAPAVLAPGTAVFVNVYGEPTVKCYSGNPLTRGTSTDPAVTTVTPARSVITHATYVNPATNTPVKVENKPSKAALAAAAKSARATADRAAAVAKAARSNADKAKTESTKANLALAAEEVKLRTANGELTTAQQQLQAAINRGAPPFVINFWQNRVKNAQTKVDTAKTSRDAAAEQARKAKEEAATQEKLAKDAEKAREELEKEAKEKESAAGLPSPTTTPGNVTKPATPEDPENKLAVEDEAAAGDEQAPAEQEPEVEGGGEQAPVEQAPVEQAPEQAEEAGA